MVKILINSDPQPNKVSLFDNVPSDPEPVSITFVELSIGSCSLVLAITYAILFLTASLENGNWAQILKELI